MSGSQLYGTRFLRLLSQATSSRSLRPGETGETAGIVGVMAGGVTVVGTIGIIGTTGTITDRLPHFRSDGAKGVTGPCCAGNRVETTFANQL